MSGGHSNSRKKSSVNLPDKQLELLEEIIRKLPVKSLLRCRLVSKTWKSSIDSPEFVAAHALRNAQPQHRLLISYYGPKKGQISFVDDRMTFPETKFNLIVPNSILRLRCKQVVGNSLGLFALKAHNKGDAHIVLWNPSIRKSIAIDVPNVLRPLNKNVFGFGVCAKTLDPKIVGIGVYPERRSNIWNKLAIVVPTKVEVYTLSLGQWRSVPTNLPSRSIKISTVHKAIDRCIYWRAFEADKYSDFNMILSFDITDETFEVINLPNCLESYHARSWSIFKHIESLAVIDDKTQSDAKCYDIWKMMDGVEKSFIKLFTVKTTPPFSMARLLVGEPNSELIDNIMISKPPGALSGVFSVFPYVETLLLHDRLEGEDNEEDPSSRLLEQNES